MVKVQELRIGNLLEDHGEYLPVGFDTFKDWTKFNFGEFLKPIPITEEWLLKFGFKLTINNKDSGYKQFGLNIKGLDLMFCLECNSDKPDFYLNMVGVDIDYIHQLQNLYFALTGVELSGF